MTNEIAVFSLLLNNKLGRHGGMGDHVVNHESKFNRRESMNFEIRKTLEIAIPLTSISKLPVYAAIIASVNTLKEIDSTWTYVTTVFIEEQKRVMKIDTDTRKAPTDKHGTLAPSWH